MGECLSNQTQDNTNSPTTTSPTTPMKRKTSKPRRTTIPPIQPDGEKEWIKEITINCPNSQCGVNITKAYLITHHMQCPLCLCLINKKIFQGLVEEVIEEFQIHPFFKHFHLRHQDFSQNGNMNFNKLTPEIQIRGGFPYYQPAKGKRFGIKVSEKYNNGDKRWLGMNGDKDEWAIAFHGVRNPDKDYNGTTALKNIMRGLHTGQMLLAGDNQFRSGSRCLITNQTINKGVYFSPHIHICLRDYTTPIMVENIQYRVVLQCRLNPNKIKICHDIQEYWVVNQTKDIRPYGIILVTEDQFKSYPSPQQCHKQRFVFSKYQQKIHDFLKKKA